MSDDRIEIDIDGDTYARLAKAADEQGVGVDELAETVSKIRHTTPLASAECADEPTGALAFSHSMCMPGDCEQCDAKPDAADGLRLACAERDEALDALSSLLLAFKRLSREFSTAEQQECLRRADAILVRVRGPEWRKQGGQ